MYQRSKVQTSSFRPTIQHISQTIKNQQQTSLFSEQQYKQLNNIKLINQAYKKHYSRKQYRQYLVNTGLNFQITDYFTYQSKFNIRQQDSIFRDVNQKSYIGWLLLLYSVVSIAMVPPWLMTIKADKFLRISWKCFMHMVMIIPFVLYERRTANEKTRMKYQLNYMFWILAFTTSFWPTAILTAIQWSYISHCFVLGSLTNLFICFQRIYSGKHTLMELIGSIFAIFGILFVIYDAISLKVQLATDFQWDVFNYYYLTRQWWQRMLGDLAAIFIGYCMSQLSKFTADIKEYYPPFLLLFLNNLFTCIFMVFSSYFFNGATFDLDSQWGVFGLFTTAHFSNFLLMGIFLTFGTFISFVMVTKIFSDPATIAIFMSFQPIISTVLFNLVNVQRIPGPYTCFGYLLIIPSIMVIILGNCLKNRSNIKQAMGNQIKIQFININHENNQQIHD